MIRFNKPTIEKKDLESVLYCMIKDDLTPGIYLKEFSAMLHNILGLSYIAVFNNYRLPFETVFAILEAGPGDEVILPSFARYSLLHGIVKQKLVPVLVDLANDSFLPAYEGISRKISKRTRCIVVPQMFGIPNDLSRYSELGIPIIEDIDGALGSKVNGKVIGCFGDFVTMNFNDDSLITTGNGGMVASKDRRLLKVLQSFKNDESSFDYLMSDFNASLGIAQMKKLEGMREKRRKIGGYYDSVVIAADCSLIGRHDGQELSYSSYVVKTHTPLSEIKRFFKGCGIPVRRGIEKPLHHYLDLDPHKFERTEEMYHKVVALPLYPSLSRESIENVAKGIRSIL